MRRLVRFISLLITSYNVFCREALNKLMRVNSLDISKIGRMFEIEGDFVSAVPYGSGHINDTFLATYHGIGSPSRYVHQRINHQIFLDPAALMENFVRITTHIRNVLRETGESGLERRILTLVPTREGRDFAIDDDGNTWRTTRYVDDVSTYDYVNNQNLAYEAGRCYGEFQFQLLSLEPGSIHTTIEDFHNTRHRFDALLLAAGSDPLNRAANASKEISFAENRESIVDRLSNLSREGLIPERIVHNDTKINNLLIDNQSQRGICVTDLDTTMPGLALHDFGDMVRTATNSAAEDMPNLDEVHMRLDIFEPLARGYLSTAGSFLTANEIRQLVFACQVIVLEIGMRFLTDYLEGDVYFKTRREEHNLDRCRVQFKLLTSIEEQRELMEQIVDSIVQ